MKTGRRRDPVEAFQRWLLDEIHKRDMSFRQFAEFVGVGHSTVARALDSTNAPAPSIEFILKLSKATGVKAITLIGLAYPEVAAQEAIPVTTELLAQRIEQLPENIKTAIMALVSQRIG